MNLENTFYTIGIIFMTFYTLLLVAVVVLLFIITKKMSEIYDQAENKWEQVKDLAQNPKETLANVGFALVDKAINKVEKEIRSKVDKKRTDH